MALIKFLGTAGARFVVAKQLRYSAGTVIKSKNATLILDPGPGTLLRLASARPKIPIETVNGVILTHIHLDHSTDANIIIDSITEGGLKKSGVLFTTDEALNSENRVILPFLKPYLEGIFTLKHKGIFEFKDIKFTSFKHNHTAETYGIRFEIEEKTVSFVVDTLFFNELLDYYKDSDYLILNVVRLSEKEGVMHLSISDVEKFIKYSNPKKVIMTHFGMTMLRANPEKVAESLSNKYGIEVIAAYDGLTVEF
ncbi:MULTISPECIES: MBL fold metallo-hydrolase [Caldisericum]|jgi:ribonuclease BN (tRNA processing enzyme)|uniref:MBL fold hydrolase n=1 Tax=Caldisericum exile TaxID=693075 RepID=A0A2J6WFN5_9BACT|nr:MAG: MBL fold hydrolase [Caldisericum exile]